MTANLYSLTFNQFASLSKKGNLIPLYREIPADLDTPVSAFLKIRSGKHDFLLESVEGGEKWGRYSFLGTKPKTVLKKSGERDSLESLKKLLGSYQPVVEPNLPRFYGGWVGYLAYDMVRHFERLPSTTKNDLHVPDAYFLLADTLLVFDNLKQIIQVIANISIDPKKPLKKLYQEGIQKIEGLIKRLQKPVVLHSKKKLLPSPQIKPHLSEPEYCRLVEKAKDYIKAGDIFQVQISTRFEGKADSEPFELYRAIRRINPSPYLYFLQLEDMALVGASPEIMVRLEGEKVELRPIAGTRRRGYTDEEDLALEKELKADPKERAEHIMLVDLGRNDLGRVCTAGTVKVDEQEVIERYSHVMHLVSHVSGKLQEGKDAFDVIRATFPAGTLTGAPKIRAMEIIEELEGYRRGVYGGCVGYIGFGGNLDMAITIRTALFHKGKIYVQAAGGIVYDSVPHLEYKECRNKARGMMKALEQC